MRTNRNASEQARPRVVIIGAGFAGLAAAHTLKGVPVDITVVDRHNYHLFQPLLYQVATASLSPAEIAQPIRSILKWQKNARVLLGEVTAINAHTKTVRLQGQADLPFDFLIVATGARHSYFGKDHWAKYAPGIKTVDDATRVRASILLAFERAEVESDPERRKALLTFVVVGGGPTGVEIAGAIAELARNSITRDFRSITPHCARIVLVEAGPRLLPVMPEMLSATARKVLEKLGVEVLLGKAVTDISAGGVTIGSEHFAARTVIWGAGVAGSPAGQWLKAPVDRAGRVVVTGDFSVPNHPDIFAVGDTAAYKQDNGASLPGVAPAAKQAGTYAAQTIAARVRAARAPARFRYRDAGNLATIGRSNALADFGWLRLSGLMGWLLWSVAHVYFLIGFRSRFIVAASWAVSWFTWQRGARLITGRDISEENQMEEAA